MCTHPVRYRHTGTIFLRHRGRGRDDYDQKNRTRLFLHAFILLPLLLFLFYINRDWMRKWALCTYNIGKKVTHTYTYILKLRPLSTAINPLCVRRWCPCTDADNPLRWNNCIFFLKNNHDGIILAYRYEYITWNRFARGVLTVSRNSCPRVPT